MADEMDANRKADGSGTGLTLKQLVLEIRQDVRALRDEIKDKVNKAEFDLLKLRFDRALSGEIEGAYGKAMLDEYEKLKKSVKQLETYNEKAILASEAAEKASAKTDSNRRWIIGLVVATIVQAAALVYGVLHGNVP